MRCFFFKISTFKVTACTVVLLFNRGLRDHGKNVIFRRARWPSGRAADTESRDSGLDAQGAWRCVLDGGT